MRRYIDLEDAKACIRNYGKQAIDSGRNDLDAVDDIVSMVEALGELVSNIHNAPNMHQKGCYTYDRKNIPCQ